MCVCVCVCVCVCSRAHTRACVKIRCSELEREREPLVQELIAAIDGHTRLHHAIRGNDVRLEGVGMVVRMIDRRFGGGEDGGSRDGGSMGGSDEDRICVVKSVTEGSSSAAMLSINDELKTINGVCVSSLSIDDVQNLFRGPSGTIVDLTGVTPHMMEAGGAAVTGSWFSVRLSRGSGSDQDEEWSSITRHTRESVEQAQQLHAQLNALSSESQADKARIVRLSDALNKLRSTPAKKPQAAGGGSAKIRAGSGGGGGSGDGECAEDQVGVGMRIKDTPPHRVMSLVDGSCALACGKIRVGDILLAVDQASVKGMPFGKLRKRLMGAKGSRLELSFTRSSGPGEVPLPGQLASSSGCQQYSVILTRGVPGDQDRVLSHHHTTVKAGQVALPVTLPACSDLAMGSGRGSFATTTQNSPRDRTDDRASRVDDDNRGRDADRDESSAAGGEGAGVSVERRGAEHVQIVPGGNGAGAGQSAI